ncbi:hypothetical protein SAMN05414139_09536 [Burkholderia sp. D7]|nr:hypothetical protein SAMN05414139_09536 [Burkholderia sp. D7]
MGTAPIRAGRRIGAEAVFVIDTAAQQVNQHPDRPEHRNNDSQQRPSATADVVEALRRKCERAPKEDNREQGCARLAKPGTGKITEGSAHERGNYDPCQPFAARNATAAQKESGGERG